MSRPRTLAALCAALALTACQDRPNGSTLVTGPRPSTAPASPPAIRAIPRVPGRPLPLADAEVQAELAAAGHAGHLGVQDAAASVAMFGRARTSRGLNQLAVGALAVLGGDRGPDASALRQELARAYNRTVLGVQPIITLHTSGVGACPVNFDDAGILGTFARPDDPQALYSAAPHWVQRCGNGNVHVEPLVHNHMHMFFEDAAIDCLDTNTGLFGRGTPASCTPVPADEALQEPRYVASHDGQSVLRIRRLVGGAPSTFTLHSFAVVGPTPVKLRYRTGNGPWFQWNSLAGNTAWDVSAYVTGVTEVQLTNAGTSLSCDPDFLTTNPPSCPAGAGAISVDDFSISPGPVLVLNGGASGRP